MLHVHTCIKVAEHKGVLQGSVSTDGMYCSNTAPCVSYSQSTSYVSSSSKNEMNFQIPLFVMSSI